MSPIKDCFLLKAESTYPNFKNIVPCFLIKYQGPQAQFSLLLMKKGFTYFLFNLFDILRLTKVEYVHIANANFLMYIFITFYLTVNEFKPKKKQKLSRRYWKTFWKGVPKS